MKEQKFFYENKFKNACKLMQVLAKLQLRVITHHVNIADK